MAPPNTPLIVFEENLANGRDAELIKKLISEYPRLKTLRQTHTMGGGYSGARIYLALAQLPATPPAYWVLKVGELEDLTAEAEAYDAANATPAVEVAVPKIHFARDGKDALLVYSFAGLNGVPPLDLEQGLRHYAAAEMLASTLKLVSRWVEQPDWKYARITEQIQAWARPKLDYLPSDLAELLDTKTLYFRDVGAVLTNPGYCIRWGALPRTEGDVPFAFTHGDFNLRNILFQTDQQGRPDSKYPRIIDLRHSGTDQWAVVDLAKLESCLVHKVFDEQDNQATPAQLDEFLNASTIEVQLHQPPKALNGNNQLLDLWRRISDLRKICSAHGK